MRKQYILYIVVITILFSLISAINVNNISALSYQSNVGVGFTFLPTLNISLSSNNLTINNLVPGGNAEDSNTITINVSTNIAEGYNLYATVGNDSSSGNNNANANTNVNNGYNTANLVNTVDNSYTFTPLSSNVLELSNFTNNTWGYSYSNDSGTTWISGDYNNASTGYNGLPLYTDTGIKLVEEADNTSSTVDFKIAARASSTQPSGEYTNVINFTVVSNTIPTTMLDAFIASGAQMYKGYFKMQDMTPTICKSIDTDGEKGMQLMDVRDDKVYWVAKLKDGNCWMTQNLDLDIGGTGVAALTSENTDISTDPNITGTGIYSNDSTGGYSESGGVWTWAPVSNTITSNSIIDYSNNTVSNWNNNNYTPASAEGGNTYFYTSNNNNNDIRYTSLADCEKYHSDCLHYHVGNYYNWTAAVASNKSSALATATDRKAGNSICPKGWQLPNFSTTDSMQNNFVNLLYNSYNIKANDSIAVNSAYQTGGFNAARTAPLWLTRSGQINEGGLTNSAVYGAYWTSIVWGSDAYELRFNTDYIWPKYYAYGYTWGRAYGFSVRCLAK